jgi:DNA-binding transcriptional LysR family regulator
MNDRDWRILAKIAETRNISRAAEQLYMSQPALSYRLGALEAEFKAQLFRRSRRGVSLTPEGEVVVAYARRMLLALQQTRERVASCGGKVAGPLRIGSSGAFANYGLPAVVAAFCQLHPRVQVHLRTGSSRAVLRMLEEEDVALAFVSGEYPWSQVKRLLREEPLYLVSRQPLALDALPEAPRILYGTDWSLTDVVEQWWTERFPSAPKVGMTVDAIETCRSMVAHGLGWAILPATGLDEGEAERRVHKTALVWSDGEPLVRRTWLLSQETSLEHPPVRAFFDHVCGALPSPP